MTDENAKYKSVYNLGASNGSIMGIYLAIMFLLQVYGLKSIILLLIGEIMMIAVPFVAYRMLVRDYDRYPHTRHFSGIWLNGIVTFICASLVLAVVMYVYMRLLNPSFIVTQVNTMADMYRQLGTPETIKMASAFENLIEQHQLPSPIQCAFSMIWLCSFSGSMLSMAIAAIIKYLTRRKPRTDSQTTL